MRIAVGGIWHESNILCTEPTRMEHFREYQLFEGPQILEALGGTGTELGGALEAARDHGVHLVPLVFAAALPGGPVSRPVFDHLLREICDRLRSADEVDGVVLALHGAMTVTGLPDPECTIVSAVRELVGSIPIAVTLDYHANVSGELVALVNDIQGYRTYPHVDMAECGYQALLSVARMAREQRRPEISLVKIPLLTVPVAQESAFAPMEGILAIARQVEDLAGTWSANALPGFAYAGESRLGFTVSVTADRDSANLSRIIASRVWEERDAFALDLVDLDVAVERARRGPHPAVIVDVADNVGGGSPGDSVAILLALQRGKAKDVVVVIWDPDAVAEAHASSVPNLNLKVGGRSSSEMGPPVVVSGPVSRFGHVEYRRSSSYMSGSSVAMGRVAVVHADIGDIVLTENRIVPFDDDHLRVLGIEPMTRRIIVAKGAIAWKAAFGAYAASTHYVSGPGLCPVDLKVLALDGLPGSVFPLKSDTGWCEQVAQSLAPL